MRTSQEKRIYPGHGDIGAAAVIPAGGKYILTGIYAYGDPGQAARGDAIGFINVFTFINWIEDVIYEDDTNTEQYRKKYNNKMYRIK